MKRLIKHLVLASAIMLMADISRAEDQPQAKPEIDPDAVVSLTVREIQAIITFNLESAKLEAVKATAVAAIAKVQAQAAKK